MVVTVIGIIMSLFHMYSGLAGSYSAMYQRSIHLGFALLLTFLVCPALSGKAKNKLVLAYDIALAILSIVSNAYILMYYEEISLTRMGIPNTLDVTMGAILVFLVLEAVRRTTASAIAPIAVVFVLYVLFGHHLGGMWGHRPYDFSRLIHQLYLTTDGVYGIVLGASANFIFLFILFPCFLQATNIGDVISDAALALMGSIRGGPAKVSIVSSSLFGMISGSGAANVAVDGAITIPLMVKQGFRPHVAAAIEATASTGGQIMPPVMGASAFVMAEVLRIGYGQVCLHALIPAVLFYFALFFSVDFEALRTGLKGLPKESLPSLKKVMKEGWVLFVPIALLFILLMVFDWSPQRAAFCTIVATIIVSFVKTHTRLTWKKAVHAMESGAVSASIDIACLCAAAGIIVGSITLSGLGMKFSAILIDLAGDSLPLLLVLTMIASIILGMGLPPVACYVLLAVLVAPALTKMGIAPIAAHLFVFYFGMLALVTPPVGAAAYIGAAIIGANPWRTGFAALTLSFSGFIIPFVFVYSPELLWIGHWWNIAWSTVTAIIGVNALAAALMGVFYWSKLNWVERGFMFVAALLLIKPGLITDAIGLTLFIGFALKNYWSGKRGASFPERAGNSV